MTHRWKWRVIWYHTSSAKTDFDRWHHYEVTQSQATGALYALWLTKLLPMDGDFWFWIEDFNVDRNWHLKFTQLIKDFASKSDENMKIEQGMNSPSKESSEMKLLEYILNTNINKRKIQSERNKHGHSRYSMFSQCLL